MHHQFDHHMDPVFAFDLPWVFISLFGFILLIALVIGIFLLIKRNSITLTSKPMEILKERFARGEIDEDEFRRRKELLEEE